MAKGLNNREAMNQAFKDMRPEIDKSRIDSGHHKTGDNYVAGISDVYTKETRKLNRLLT